jgi:hypothetical protein
MKYHGPSDLGRFLQAVDAALEEPARLLVIGGAAAALHYGAKRHTADIDTLQPISPSLERAIAVARRQTKLDIPVSYAAIADAPYDFEDRLQSVRELGLTKLDLYVPERHDLALMKTIRGYEHDLEVIAEMHRKNPLDLETLKTRFAGEMSHVVSDPRKLRLNFVLVVDRLYGADAASRVRDELERSARRGRDRGPDR